MQRVSRKWRHGLNAWARAPARIFTPSRLKKTCRRFGAKLQRVNKRLEILYLASWFPFPADNGSRQRTFYLLRALAARHQVSLIAVYDAEQAPPQLDALRAYSADISALPRKIFIPHRARALRAFLSPQPRSVIDTFDAELAARVQTSVTQTAYDAILVGELAMAPYARAIRGPRKILDDIEASVFADPFQQARGFGRIRRGLTWWKFQNYIRTLASEFDALTVVSAREQKLLQAMAIRAKQIHIVPNGVDVSAADAIVGTAEPNTLIYNGSLTFAPNQDAMRFFVREMLPLVRAHAPNVVLRITGRADQVAQKELSADNIV
ncbi:hypothetical protein FBQ82_17000, partial [Anaerolineae bacterium CFX7]|nr:hypothetical protein [Anaerolineae bacterium CFX7]